jgi:hypothetical protein
MAEIRTLVTEAIAATTAPIVSAVTMVTAERRVEVDAVIGTP